MVTFVSITCTLESWSFQTSGINLPFNSVFQQHGLSFHTLWKRPVTLTPAIFSGVAYDTFLLSGLFPLHFLTAWVRQTLITCSNRIAASLASYQNTTSNWVWNILNGPGSPLDLVHILSLLLTPCSQSPHPSAGEPPAQPRRQSNSVLPFLTGPVLWGSACITECPFMHISKGKKRWLTSAKIKWASLKMWDLSRDSKGVGQLPRGSVEEGHCWEEGTWGPSSSRGAWCVQGIRWERRRNGRRGVGEAGASPLAVVTAQNLWQILTFTLSELEFF